MQDPKLAVVNHFVNILSEYYQNFLLIQTWCNVIDKVVVVVKVGELSEVYIPTEYHMTNIVISDIFVFFFLLHILITSSVYSVVILSWPSAHLQPSIVHPL